MLSLRVSSTKIMMLPKLWRLLFSWRPFLGEKLLHRGRSRFLRSVLGKFQRCSCCSTIIHREALRAMSLRWISKLLCRRLSDKGLGDSLRTNFAVKFFASGLTLSRASVNRSPLLGASIISRILAPLFAAVRNRSRKFVPIRDQEFQACDYVAFYFSFFKE